MADDFEIEECVRGILAVYDDCVKEQVEHFHRRHAAMAASANADKAMARKIQAIFDEQIKCYTDGIAAGLLCNLCIIWGMDRDKAVKLGSEEIRKRTSEGKNIVSCIKENGVTVKRSKFKGERK